MTATLDTNVLLYASDESSRFHDRAIDVLQGLAAGPSLVYLFWPVALGYVRIATHPAIFQKPLTADEMVFKRIRVPGEEDVDVKALLAGTGGANWREAVKR